jgi:amino acid adenylation domain-containing protein
MTSIASFLIKLKNQGIKLWLEDQSLRYSAPRRVITPELATEIQAYKSEIIAFLQQNYAVNSPPLFISKVDRTNTDLSLSFAQQRLWFLDQLEGMNDNYNISQALKFQGVLNLKALEKALNQIIERHEVLRTNFQVKNDLPVQVIRPHHPIEIPVIDIENLSEKEQSIKISQLINEEAEISFDLAKDLLLRAKIIRLKKKEHIFLLTMHHIVSDGGSLGILIDELSTIYQAECESKPANLKPLLVQYVDFALWQKRHLTGENLAKNLNYWQQKLADVPPLLPLATDYPRPPIQSFRGDTVRFYINQELTAKIRNLSRQEKTTLFITILTAFKILLSYYSQQDDIIVGSPINNRNRQEVEPLIGFFVNNLVLRSKIDLSLDFYTLLKQVHQTSLEAYQYQELPFEKLVEELNPERNLSYTPIFQVMLGFNNNEFRSWNLPGLEISSFPLERKTAKFDLTLFIRETPSRLEANLQYSTDLFKRSTIERMIEHFQILLEQITTNPHQSISKLSILTVTERQQILGEWNQTQSEYIPQPFPKLFELQAQKTPHEIAVIFEQKKLTYHELNTQSNQLANYLKKLGVKTETFVGIYLERSLEMLIALLAILKAGGVYIPLDTNYPLERIAYMINDSQLQYIVTKENLLTQLPSSNANIICWETIPPTPLNPPLLREEFDSPQPPLLREETTPPTPLTKIDPSTFRPPLTKGGSGGVNLENLAYVIYTSGSTGNPKGVQISHKSLTNLLQSMLFSLNVTKEDIFLALTTISFDIAAIELYLPLILGAKLVIASSEVALDPTLLLQQMEEQQITVIQATPATWQNLVQVGWDQTRSKPLKILCGGEALSKQLAQELLKRSPQVWNLYGPTETTIWSTTYKIETIPDNPSSNIPLGRPINNTHIYILDSFLNPVGIGIVGELYIGGNGLAKGYWNLPQLTTEKFIPNPFGEGKLYKTGDLVRYLEDGNIEFLGRKDNQVKLRGFRIELGEIEAVLKQHPSVLDVAVILWGEEIQDKHLVAYVVSQDLSTTTKPLVDFLQQKLPMYMIPSAFVFLPQLPLTLNGKIDRLSLPDPDPNHYSTSNKEFTPPQTPIQETLVQIWQEVLKLEQVGIDDHFFELGGHSLLATQIISRINSNFGIKFPLKDLFENPVLKDLAEHIELISWLNSDSDQGFEQNLPSNYQSVIL